MKLKSRKNLLKASARFITLGSWGVPIATARALQTVASEWAQDSSRHSGSDWMLVFCGEVLAGSFQSAGPVFVKFGQVLASREDILPPSLCQRLSKLYDKQNPTPFHQIKKRVDEAFPEKPFSHIEKKALGVGTVGQVHRARLKDQTEVVIKIIKPGIKEAVQQDLSLFRSVLSLLPPKLRKDLVMIEHALEDLAESFGAEMDLRREAQNLLEFKERCRKNPRIYVPDCYPSMLTEDIMVMEYLEGEPLGSLNDRVDSPKRKELATLVVREVLTQVFEKGHFHGDPHGGNLLLLPDGRVAFIDLGLTGELSLSARRALTNVLRAMLSRNPDQAMDALLSFAVVPENFDRTTFRAGVAQVYKEFKGKAQQRNLEQLVAALFQQAYRAGLYLPPATTVFIKAMVTVEGLARTLDPEIDIKSVATGTVLKASARGFFSRLTQWGRAESKDPAQNESRVPKSTPRD